MYNAEGHDGNVVSCWLCTAMNQLTYRIIWANQNEFVSLGKLNKYEKDILCDKLTKRPFIKKDKIKENREISFDEVGRATIRRPSPFPGGEAARAKYASPANRSSHFLVRFHDKKLLFFWILSKWAGGVRTLHYLVQKDHPWLRGSMTKNCHIIVSVYDDTKSEWSCRTLFHFYLCFAS